MAYTYINGFTAPLPFLPFVGNLLVTSWHVQIVCRVANKSATSWQLPRLRWSYIRVNVSSGCCPLPYCIQTVLTASGTVQLTLVSDPLHQHYHTTKAELNPSNSPLPTHSKQSLSLLSLLSHSPRHTPQMWQTSKNIINVNKRVYYEKDCKHL